jgi:hypothetical protein
MNAMESKLLPLLTVLTTAITIVVVVYLFTGPGYAIELAVVSLAALAAWLRWSFREPPDQRPLVAAYILVIVATLAMNTGRYWSEYATFFAEHWPSFFAPGFRLTDPWWLALSVFGPVCLMLLGGYYLVIRRPLGFYMAWWTSCYAIAEALLHYKLEFATAEAYMHRSFVGAVGASALLIIGVIGIQRLVAARSADDPADLQTGGLTSRQANRWMALFAALVVVYGVVLYSQSGIMAVGVISAAMTAGLIAWRRTTAHHPADPHKLVPLYLLLMGLFYFHVGEEVLSPIPFNQAIAAISGTPWSDTDFTFVINLIGPAIWVFGAWSLWKRQPFGNFILWYMSIGMILGEPAHFLVFPVVAMNKLGIGYQYFSGMYTALFPMIPAILIVTTLLRDYRRAVALTSVERHDRGSRVLGSETVS